MEPLIVLVAVTALLLIAGAAGVRRLRDWHAALRGAWPPCSCSQGSPTSVPSGCVTTW
jgi:hypothetical protein